MGDLKHYIALIQTLSSAPWLVTHLLSIDAGLMKECLEGSQVSSKCCLAYRILHRQIAEISGSTGNFVKFPIKPEIPQIYITHGSRGSG